MPAHVERHWGGLHAISDNEQHFEPSITQGVVDCHIKCKGIAGHWFIKLVRQLEGSKCVGQLCISDAEPPATHQAMQCIVTGRIGGVLIHRQLVARVEEIIFALFREQAM